MKNFTNLLIFLGIISFVFLGCAKKDDSSSSSSTSDTDVSATSGSGAITLSSKVSMVTANTSASTARTAFAHFTTDNFSATADYNNDDTQTFVYERSADAFNTANMILCWMQQSRADLMLNAGNYKAQIDTAKCEEGSGDSKSNTPKYEMWTLNSSRAEGEPMIVKAWIPFDDNEDGEPDSMIYAQNKIYRGPSTTYPWGFFKMNFKLLQGKTTSGTELFKGYLKTRLRDGASILQFYNPQPDSSGNIFQYSVTAKINSDGSGAGITTMPKWDQSGPTSTQRTYNVAFNSNYFYKQKTTVTSGTTTTRDPVCLDRNKYLLQVNRYGLYNDNGSRVEVNSGFPIKATNSGTDYYGYIGYYGLWMPSDASVADNSTVAKMDFSGGADQTGTSYTVRSWGGKLMKWTKNTITLGSIKNIPLSWQDPSDSYIEKRVYWDGSNLVFDAVRDTTTYMWTDLTPDNLTLSSSNAPYGFFFYSQALGGDGSIQLTYGSGGSWNVPNAPADSTSVVFNTRESIFPGDSAPSTLACYDRCPNPATLASGTETTAYLRFSGLDNASATNAYMYSFDNTTSGMVLKFDNNSTSTSVLLSSANSNLSYGVHSGILFDNTSANYTALQCDWNSSYICPWNARQAMSTFYTWETGPNQWNKLTVLVASDNSSVKFDPPMNVKYTHSGTGSNSGKSYDNATFYLEYGGHGDLWGLPSFCISRKTGEKTSCSNDGTTRWIEEITIPATSIATQTKDRTTHYMVKPLDIEQTMKKASSSSVCTAAGLSLGGLSLPDVSRYSDPDIGAKPSVSGPPAVVAGAKM